MVTMWTNVVEGMMAYSPEELEDHAYLAMQASSKQRFTV